MNEKCASRGFEGIRKKGNEMEKFFTITVIRIHAIRIGRDTQENGWGGKSRHSACVRVHGISVVSKGRTSKL